MQLFTVTCQVSEEKLGPFMKNLLPHVETYQMGLVQEVPFTKNTPRAKTARGKYKRKAKAKRTSFGKKGTRITDQIRSTIASLPTAFTVKQLTAKHNPKNVSNLLNRMLKAKALKKTGIGQYVKVA